MNGGHPLPSPPPPSKADDAIPELVELLGKFDWATDTVERCARTISNDMSTIPELTAAVQELKQLLCTSRDHVFPIAQDVIDSGVLEGLVRLTGNRHHRQLLQGSGCYSSELRLPAAFCLTNIAAGSDEQTAAVVAAGAVPVMLELLRSPEECLRRQAIFCLANVAGSTPEFRALLACHPTYVSSLKYAIDNSIDPRIEELAGWNLRNMIVLGGATFEQSIPALEIFIEQTLSNAPSPRECFTMMVNGSATFTSVQHNAANWFKFGPGVTAIHTGFMAGIMSPPCNSASKGVLRFAAEAFSHVSRTPQGSALLLEADLIGPILYLAKFCPNPSVRNYMLETLVNLSADRATAKSHFYSLGGLHGLGEMLADNFSYTPHQRVLVAKILWRLAMASTYLEADTATKNVIVTRAATIEARREILQAAFTFLQERSEVSPHEFNLEDSLEDIDLDALEGMPSDQNRESLLDIAYSIFIEAYGPEELSLREKCGRLIVTILSKVSEHILARYFSSEFLLFIIKLAEFAAQVDVISINSGAADGLSSLSSETNSSGIVPADILNALKVGEYQDNPDSMFLLSTLKLIERVFTVGDMLRMKGRTIDNPMSAMIRQDEGVARLEACVSQGALPLDVVNEAIRMIEKYAY